MSILRKIIETKKEEVAIAKRHKSLDDIYEEAKNFSRTTISFSGSIASTPGGIIAEFKRRSPSKGDINNRVSLESVVSGYENCGAVAISVLTDSQYFGGSLDDLKQARKLVSLPLLRKDFIIDPYQICEARISGADAILLIASALSVPQTRELARFARSLGLEVLLEIHGEDELGHICDEINVVGVNNRNLGTFITDTAVSKRLAPMLPAGKLRISESGISHPATVKELTEYGYRGFLMGENFMKHDHPAGALKDFLEELC